MPVTWLIVFERVWVRAAKHAASMNECCEVMRNISIVGKIYHEYGIVAEEIQKNGLQNRNQRPKKP